MEATRIPSTRLTAVVFCKALVVYLIVRMVAHWVVVAQIAPDRLLELPRAIIPRIFFWPSYWAGDHLHAFYMFAIAGLLILLWLPWNYIGAMFFFVLTFNLYRLNLGIANGSDLVLSMLACYSIGMATRPKWGSRFGGEFQQIVFTLAVVFCQIQIAGIYFVSGWDKLTSDVWRSGEVFVRIMHYDPLFNPRFASFLDIPNVRLILSWLTILFELTFAGLVWFKRLKYYVLILGILFHFTIIVMLSLPEFGILMILSYLIFLNDEDYDRIRSKVKLLQG